MWLPTTISATTVGSWAVTTGPSAWVWPGSAAALPAASRTVAVLKTPPRGRSTSTRSPACRSSRSPPAISRATACGGVMRPFTAGACRPSTIWVVKTIDTPVCLASASRDASSGPACKCTSVAVMGLGAASTAGAAPAASAIVLKPSKRRRERIRICFPPSRRGAAVLAGAAGRGVGETPGKGSYPTRLEKLL